ncbi:MAG TPA: hypothetical protein VF517_11600 [Thermoleophilaceae bacterium]|jgi:hypothetical protein
MESYPGTAGPATSEDLARVADELLEHTRALRRQHEELRDALAGISAVAAHEPLDRDEDEADGGHQNGATPETLHPMVLQMALAGETREFARDQLHALDVEDADELVDDVFDRVDSQRPAHRRRLFTRRAG